MAKLTDNQAYARAKEYEEVYRTFRDVREVFQKAEEVNGRQAALEKSIQPLIDKNLKLKDEEKERADAIAGLDNVLKEGLKKVDDAVSVRKTQFSKDNSKWNKIIADKEKRYYRLISDKDKEYEDMLLSKTREADAIEDRLVLLRKEYNDFQAVLDKPIGV